MAYIDIEKYKSLYGEISASEFTRFEMSARRKLDNYTTGIDGIKKLVSAFPITEDDAECVVHCMAALIDAIRTAEKAQKVTETANGVHSNVITSVSAGNESAHFATFGGAADQEKVYRGIIHEYLSGVYDANGVNLLYLGRYPYTIETK